MSLIKNLLGRARGLVRVQDLQKVLARLARSSGFVELTVSGVFAKRADWSGGTESFLFLKSVTASKAFAGGATEVITLGIPAGAVLVAAQLRNNTALTGTTAVSYSAAYSGGATQSIATGVNFTKNTKSGKFFTVKGSGEADNITSNTTDITLTPNAGTLDTGTVEATVYYYELQAPDNIA